MPEAHCGRLRASALCIYPSRTLSSRASTARAEANRRTVLGRARRTPRYMLGRLDFAAQKVVRLILF
jgi:hypothetical protein